MRLITEFGFDFVARSACAVVVFPGWIFGVRITTLNHEAFHNSMKSCAIIEPLPSELFEIFDRFRRDVGPKFDHNLTLGGRNNRYFVCCAHVRNRLNGFEISPSFLPASYRHPANRRE